MYKWINVNIVTEEYLKKNKDNIICNKCIKKYKCNGKGECFNMKYKKMFNCPYKCELKQCQKCFNNIPEVYLIIHGGICIDCKIEEDDEEK